MNKILLATSLAISITACGGGGGSDDPDTIITPSGTDNKSVTLSDMTGIWNATQNTIYGQDITYLAIYSSGIVKDYDYMGDTFDEGEACYWLTGNTVNDEVKFHDNGAGSFTITSNDFGTVISTTMTATLSGETLSLTWIDAFDDDEDGNTTETQTITMTRAIGLEESDFVPLCDDNGNSADAVVVIPPEDLIDSGAREITLDDISGTWRTNFLSLEPATYLQIADGQMKEFQASRVHSENGWVTCYNEQTDVSAVQVSDLGNNLFNANFMVNDLTLSTTLTAEAEYGIYDFALSFADVTDRNGNGDTTETLYIKLRKETDQIKASLAPLCSDIQETPVTTWQNVCDTKVAAAKATYGEPENDYKSVSSWFWYWSMDWYSKGISKTFTASSYDDLPVCEVTNMTYTPF